MREVPIKNKTLFVVLVLAAFGLSLLAVASVARL